MVDLEARTEALERQVRMLEDHLDICRIISSYGPAADCGSGEFAASLWTKDGVFDAQVATWTGRQAIAAHIDGQAHERVMESGCAHVIGMPLVTIDGDRAIATCYARVYRWNEQGFDVSRVTANRWELIRIEGHWQVNRRVNRLLDGNEDARQLLRMAVAATPDR